MASGLNSARSRRKTNSPSSVPSARAVTEQMHSFFSEIEDPRSQRTRAHLLTDILIIGILSVIAGGNSKPKSFPQRAIANCSYVN